MHQLFSEKVAAGAPATANCHPPNSPFFSLSFVTKGMFGLSIKYIDNCR